MDGELEASTSGGDISLRMVTPADVTLSTTGGSIDIVVPRNMGAEVFLQADEVMLNGSVEFSGSRQEDKIDGRINGGGAKIRAQSHHGEVSLRVE